MSYLEIQNLSKSFARNGKRGVPLPVLRDVNLSIRQNEFVCIVGRSGAGKTTLVSLIAGLLMPDEGSLALEGRRIDGPGPERGVIFQNYSLLPWMTVFENVYLAVDAVAGGSSESAKRQRTEYYINLVNLGAAMKKSPRELSGGMRQRVAVARGLAMDPKVLLLDEPFSALDALTRGTLQEELGRIWMETRKTVVMITNDIDEALLLADTIYTLTSGPAATLGAAVRVETAHPRTRAQLSADKSYQRARRQVLRGLVGECPPARAIAIDGSGENLLKRTGT